MSRYFSLGYRYFAEETLARDRRLLSVIPWDKRDNYELEVTYVAKVTAVNRLDGHRVTLAEASEVQAVPEQTLNDYVSQGSDNRLRCSFTSLKLQCSWLRVKLVRTPLPIPSAFVPTPASRKAYLCLSLTRLLTRLSLLLGRAP